jgi:hypothetical protein
MQHDAPPVTIDEAEELPEEVRAGVHKLHNVSVALSSTVLASFLSNILATLGLLFDRETDTRRLFASTSAPWTRVIRSSKST